MFELIFGAIFFFAGLCATTGLLVSAFSLGEYMLIGMALVFCLVFCGIGGSFLIVGIKKIKANKDVDKHGISYYAKIVSYSDSNVSINGVPLLIITLIYYDNGIIKVIDVDTQQTNESKYPLLNTAVVKIYNGIGKVVKNSVGTEIPFDINDEFDEYINKKRMELEEVEKLNRINWS